MPNFVPSPALDRFLCHVSSQKTRTIIALCGLSFISAVAALLVYSGGTVSLSAYRGADLTLQEEFPPKSCISYISCMLRPLMT